MLAWHFINGTKLRSGREARVGQIVKLKGKIRICEWGLHASIRAIDALRYAPGATICRVDVTGDIQEQDDKLCGRRRKILAMADASTVLHTFACDVAEQALLALPSHDPRSMEAVRVKRLWIKGEATNQELSAAESAAESAARSAAESAARSAAWNAALQAWSAAWSAARSAAWNAAESAQNEKLEKMLRELLGGVE